MANNLTGKISQVLGAVVDVEFDVTTKEPPNKNHPYYSILNHPNFIWTPHTAWASNETLQEAINQ